MPSIAAKGMDSPIVVPAGAVLTHNLRAAKKLPALPAKPICHRALRRRPQAPIDAAKLNGDRRRVRIATGGLRMAEVTLALPEAMEQAVTGYGRGDFAEAARLARTIVSIEPDYFDALHLIAVIDTQQRRLEKALAGYDRTLALRPDHAEALNNRGLTLHLLERFEEALASYDGALALRPDYVQAFFNRGVTLQALG